MLLAYSKTSNVASKESHHTAQRDKRGPNLKPIKRTTSPAAVIIFVQTTVHTIRCIALFHYLQRVVIVAMIDNVVPRACTIDFPVTISRSA